MCGICGLVGRSSGPPVDRRLLVRMRDTMIHRGPDDAGEYVAGPVGLGHRRLSIIDLSPAARQPMSNEDGTVWLVANGEVYNYKELSRSLKSLGHRFRSQSDSEVVLHCYEEYGEDFLQHLRGMFALALWDERSSRLLLARDRVGIKPLYYCQTGGILAFASEIKALLEVPEVPRALNQRALPQYLVSLYVYGDETLFQDIHELSPGHYLLYEDGRASVHSYWDQDLVPVQCDEGDLEDQMGTLLAGAVESHLASDVPLGVFLSGGVDSSTIVALMARMAGSPVKTFSVGFSIEGFSELHYARQVAQRFGTEHHEILLSPREFGGALRRLIWHHDEPLTFPASIPLYFLAKAAKEKVTVVLTGEGADELFAGYGSYARAMRQMVWNQLVPRFAGRGAAKLFGFCGTQRYQRASLRFAMEPWQVAMEYKAAVDLVTRGEILSGDCAGGHFRECFDGLNEAPDFLSRMLYTDLKTYLVALLMKQDKMSMAASIESRVPFLDDSILGFAATIPSGMKLNHGAGKYLLKRVAARFLPPEIVNRGKAGFPVPISSWFRNELADSLDLLFEPRTEARGYFNYLFIREVAERHRQGKSDYGYLLWALLNLELWIRIFLEGEAA